jgi:hypothetical protein
VVEEHHQVVVWVEEWEEAAWVEWEEHHLHLQKEEKKERHQKEEKLLHQQNQLPHQQHKIIRKRLSPKMIGVFIK